MKKLACVLALSSAFLSMDALAWGNDGHRAVGAIADKLLKGTNAEKQIAALLLPGESLESIANWADCVKGTYCGPQTPEMLDRYERYVVPAVALADQAAMARIGERWKFEATEGPAYRGPTLIVAGRQDSTVGYAAAAGLLDYYPRATLAVLDGAGHALPHEQPRLLAGLLDDWLARSAIGPTPES